MMEKPGEALPTIPITDAACERREYNPPRLTVYGSLETLTRGEGNDNDDGVIGSKDIT